MRLLNTILILLFMASLALAEDSSDGFLAIAKRIDGLQEQAPAAASWQPVSSAIEQRNAIVVSALLTDRTIDKNIDRFGSAEMKRLWGQLKQKWDPAVFAEKKSGQGVNGFSDYKKLFMSLCLPPQPEQMDPKQWLIKREPLPKGFGDGDISDYKAYERGYYLGVVLLSAHVWKSDKFTDMIAKHAGVSGNLLASAQAGARDAWERNGFLFTKDGKRDLSKETKQETANDGGTLRTCAKGKAIIEHYLPDGSLDLLSPLDAHNEECGECISYYPNGKLSLLFYRFNDKTKIG
jgi:hypothetical protein